MSGNSPWKTISVAEAVQKQRGKEVIKLQTAAYQKNGTLPIVDQGATFICGYTDNNSARYPYELPVIIFGDHTRILKYVDFPFAIGADGTQCLRPTEDFDPRYFYYALDALALPSEGYARHFKLLKERHIPVPTLNEQRQIAQVLLSVDRSITAANDVLGQTREARTHQLECLMALPGSMRPLKDVCRLSGGNGFPIKYQGKREGRYPFAKVSDMNRPGNEIELKSAENYVGREEVDLLRLKVFPPGTTFFPKVGATLLTNKRRISAREIIVDNNVMAAEATGIDPWFLFYAFNTIDMADYVQPGAVPSVNQGTIGQIMIPVPSLQIQQRYVGVMRDFDRAIQSQAGAVGRLTRTKNALKGDLFSGRVRVTE
ncbi:hypothetical protein FV219_00845 [Methylobacterium sp. WL122]|nr:hypothetical protein FV219_00845 [Methylobacterium sp. WL122]